MVILLVACAYIILVLAYRASANRGAQELSTVLSGWGSIGMLNKRTVYSAPLMILALVLYRENTFLQPAWNERWQAITILLAVVCVMVSVLSAQRIKHTVIKVAGKKKPRLI